MKTVGNFFAGAMLLVFGTNAFAAGNANILDLRKFEAEAKASIASTFGREAVKTGSERMLFQDGAGAAGIPPLFDFASVNYVVEMKAGVLPAGNYQLSYRLSLNGGQTGLKLVQVPGGNNSLTFFAANSGTVVYKQGATKSERQQLIREIRTVAPGANVSDLETIGVMVYEVKPAEGAKVARVIAASRIVDSVEMQGENYATPFEFDAPVHLSMRDGKVDVNSFRTVTKRYKEMGCPFSSETSVPQRLR